MILNKIKISRRYCAHFRISNLACFDLYFLLFQVVQLFASIHSDSRIKQVTDLENEANQIDLIRSYIKGESRKETMLHTTLESMIETLKRNRNISKELMQ